MTRKEIAAANERFSSYMDARIVFSNNETDSLIWLNKAGAIQSFMKMCGYEWNENKQTFVKGVVY